MFDIVLEYFLDLNIIMCYGGLFWVDMCVVLMWKWFNFYWIFFDIVIGVMLFLIVDYGCMDGKDCLMMVMGFFVFFFEEKVLEVEVGGLFEGEVVENYVWKNVECVFLYW